MAGWRGLQSRGLRRYGGAELHPLAAGPRAECVAAPAQCQNNKYRTLDGSCNNLRRPAWGMAGTRYARLVPAKYADGKDNGSDTREPPQSSDL